MEIDVSEQTGNVCYSWHKREVGAVREKIANPGEAVGAGCSKHRC